MKDYCFRYSVHMDIQRGRMTPSGWATRNRAGTRIPAALLGTPTNAKLAQFVADYNLSLLPAGVNSHLGPESRCIAARILDHDNDQRVVAEWKEA